MGDMVEVDSLRLLAVETDVKHLSNDVGEIKGELSDIRTINKNVAESLARLTVIAEQNQKLEPKLDRLSVHMEERINGIGTRLEDRIRVNDRLIWIAVGGVTIIGSALTFFGNEIRAVF
ncbi:hypothetical protein B621_gp51 [Marinomonas phage P12026]|uniref:hypothetical protein n=1 Tax=Marinomonas phage P12026 TaxID=1176423 RepID=UPI0002688FAE|nr:hypothetical protein B621_gp51 [Marinomonas phage P12026]AFM54897.1 hypothetical protein P12026_51 [Marinomonas phage P12026]